VLAWSCASGDDDTLAPLPIEGGTAAAVVTATASTQASTTTAPVLPRAPMADPSASTTATSTTPAVATGDWDGARFDVGTIDGVTTTGAATSIALDRWSYTGPDGATVDAGGLRAEPVVAWWRTSPFSNVRVQTRTFVLAPDVEVLVLDPAGRATACAEPPPATPPVARWVESPSSSIEPSAPGEIAVLTYSDTGLVTRVRVTRGC
jgi:hypothetical protein